MDTEPADPTPLVVTDSQYGARREARKNVSWVGHIKLHDGADLPCAIKDVSKSGAKIVVHSSFALSKSFDLIIDERNLILSVTVRWRQGNFVGIQIDRIRRIPGRPRWSPVIDDE